jgi:hypothetical protein
VLWRLQARATQFWNQRAAPAISPNGRYALVEIPPEAGRAMVALVSMKDGKIRQRFSAVHVGSYKQAFGFTEGGKRVWLTSGNIVFRYRLREA